MFESIANNFPLFLGITYLGKPGGDDGHKFNAFIGAAFYCFKRHVGGDDNYSEVNLSRHIGDILIGSQAQYFTAGRIYRKYFPFIFTKNEITDNSIPQLPGF